MSRLLRVAVLLAFAVTYGRSESCTSVTTGEKANICRCDGSDFYIDISKYLTYPKEKIPDDVQPAKYNYTFSPCAPIDCSTLGANAADSYVCQKEVTGGDQTPSLGRNVVANWTITSMSPLVFTITYTGGDPANNVKRRSIVKFIHDTGTPSMAFVSEDQSTLTYNFELTGNVVTIVSIGGGGGGGVAAGIPGIVIMILLLVAVVTYFTVGAFINYLHLGARGVEIIPQYTFWKDVPFLIKDGFLFMLSPCYHPDKGSYQSL